MSPSHAHILVHFLDPVHVTLRGFDIVFAVFLVEPICDHRQRSANERSRYTHPYSNSNPVIYGTSLSGGNQ